MQMSRKFCAPLDVLSGIPAPLQGKSQSGLPRDRRRDDRESPDHDPPGLDADILLEISGLGALADEEDEPLDLAVPVLFRSGYCR